MLAEDVLSSSAINILFIVLVFVSLGCMYFTQVEYKRTAVDNSEEPPAAVLDNDHRLSISNESTPVVEPRTLGKSVRIQLT